MANPTFPTTLIVVAFVLIVAPRHCAGDERPERLTVATWNLEWFFDENTGDNYSSLGKKLSAPTREDWNWKRDRVAEVIAQLKPTVLALQEVENRQTVWYLCRRLKEEHDLNYRIAFITGTDFFTEQDVAMIFRSGLVEFSRREQSNEQWRDKSLFGLPKHLFARFQWGEGDERESLTLLNLHLRASARGAKIRQRQARLARVWINEALAREPNLIVLGDFNTDEPAEASAESEIGIVRGLALDRSARLLDLHSRLPADARDTHLIGKAFDRILVSPALMQDDPARSDLMFRSLERRKDLVVRGELQDKDHRDLYYKIPAEERDVSDHYPLIAEFAWK